LGTIFTGVLCMLLSSVGGVISHVAAQSRPGPTGPAATYKWLDSGTIQASNFYDGQTTTSTYNFVDSNPSDATHEYIAQALHYCQPPKITADPNNNPGSGSLITFTSNSNNTSCTQDKAVGITITDTNNAGQGPTIDPKNPNQQDYRNTIFTWGDSNNINATNYIADTFSYDGSSKFVRQGYAQGNCRDYITLPDNNKPDQGLLHITSAFRNTCQESTKDISMQNTAASGRGTFAPPTGPEITACDLTFNLTTILSLKWVICPIIEGIQFAVGKLDDLLNSQLNPDMSVFDDNGGFHQAWNSFRVIGLGIIAIAALVMVVAQAAGFEIMSAYAFKKVLPTLLAAAFFIGFSWPLIKLGFQASSDITSGVRVLIYAPFQHFGKLELGGGSSFSLILLGTGGALALGWSGLISLLGTAALAIITALGTLLLIHTAGLVLTITSPVWIACSILPGTKKVYTFCKDGLVVVLIVPIAISGVIAGMRVLAVITYHSPGNTTVHQLLALLIYDAADFSVAWVAIRVGGLVQTLTGVVNDRSRGAFDRLKNFRGKKMKENFGAMKSGTRFADNNPLSRTFNTTTQGLGTGVKGHFGLGGRGGEARDQASRKAATELMKTAEWQAIKEDDTAKEAGTYNSETAAVRGLMARGVDQAEARRAARAVKTSIGYSRASQIASAMGMSDTGTAFVDNDHQASVLGRASNGNASTAASLAGYANFMNKQKGRHDLAPGFGELHSAVRQEAGLEQGPRNNAERAARTARLMSASMRNADPVTLARDRTPGYKNMLEHAATTYQQAQTRHAAAVASGNQREQQEALLQAQDAERFLYEQEQSKMYASGENASALAEITQRVDGQREWLNNTTRVGAGPVTVVRRDPNDPNKLQSFKEAPTYGAEARAGARVAPRPDVNRE